MERGLIVEQDYIDAKTGKRCIIVFNHLGVRCAYVEVNNQIPISVHGDYYTQSKAENTPQILSGRHKFPFRSVRLPAHGGITFTGNLDYIDEETKFIGIDFAHYSDLRDLDAYKKYFGTHSALYKAIKEINRSAKIFGRLYSIEDVKHELELLASVLYKYEQLELRRLKNAKAYNWKHRNTQKNYSKYRGLN